MKTKIGRVFASHGSATQRIAFIPSFNAANVLLPLFQRRVISQSANYVAARGSSICIHPGPARPGGACGSAYAYFTIWQEQATERYRADTWTARRAYMHTSNMQW